MAPLSKFVASLQRQQPSETGAPVEEQQVDVKNEKGSGDSDVEEGDAASKELTTAVDPDLNPGGLTFEEGACPCPALLPSAR